MVHDFKINKIGSEVWIYHFSVLIYNAHPTCCVVIFQKESSVKKQSKESRKGIITQYKNDGCN